ncbi:hypothetical protein J437_LFUL001983 [Ladona fulva]|uniref:Uncharacterized protein n=1 Tax=Ladona fulva TaxID=123851 RepID=A0A8K0K0W7_LADFU|nr:hypothetical protein J437_LFUL001983 [Ladona fulva]
MLRNTGESKQQWCYLSFRLHFQEDLLIHGDSVYDIIDKQDHRGIQAELCGGGSGAGGPGVGCGGPPMDKDQRLFLCRMNVSRNARRQMRFGDQKLPDIKRRLALMFLTRKVPILKPSFRHTFSDFLVGISKLSLYLEVKILKDFFCFSGEFHLGYPRCELQGASWYHLLHWESMREAQSKHRLITQSEQERSCILLVRLQRRTGDWLWVHCVLQAKDGGTSGGSGGGAGGTGNGTDANCAGGGGQPVIVCTNQVLRRLAGYQANERLLLCRLTHGFTIITPCKANYSTG